MSALTHAMSTEGYRIHLPSCQIAVGSAISRYYSTLSLNQRNDPSVLSPAFRFFTRRPTGYAGIDSGLLYVRGASVAVPDCPRGAATRVDAMRMNRAMGRTCMDESFLKVPAGLATPN